MLTPNQGPMPSMVENNQVIYPLLGTASDGIRAFGEVPEETALGNGMDFIATPQGPMNDLMSVRAMFPFLPIVPFPPVVRNLFLDNANVAEDLIIPDRAVLMCVRGNNDFYCCINGRAAVPSAADTSIGDNENKSFYAPQGFMFYTGGLRSMSMVAPNASTIITALFWMPDQMPR